MRIRTSPEMSCVALLALGTAVSGCSGVFSPGGSCNSAEGIEVCTPSSEYSQGSVVELRITNRSQATVYLDVCSIQLTATTPGIPSRKPGYNPERDCGPDVTSDEIVAMMREVPSGETIRQNARIAPGVAQGDYVFNLWFLDEEGQLLSLEPLPTAEFDVFPSAGN